MDQGIVDHVGENPPQPSRPGEHDRIAGVDVDRSLADPVLYGAVWPYPVAGAARTAEQPAAAGESPSQPAIDIAADEARATADESGLPDAEAIGELGDPAAAIMRAAEDHDVDVIVLGTKERGWFDRVLHPSVSQHVVKHSTIPVLVVK